MLGWEAVYTKINEIKTENVNHAVYIPGFDLQCPLSILCNDYYKIVMMN